MIWWVILIEAIIFAGIFTTIVLTAAHGDKKYNTANIANYPPDIQEEYFKTHERMEVSYRSKKVILTKSLGILMFTAILFVSSLFAGAKTFWEGFSAFLRTDGVDRRIRYLLYRLGAVRQFEDVSFRGHRAYG